MLRVLIITQYFWPESFRITDLAVALRERGHDVVVLTGLPNYPQGHFFGGYGIRGPWRDTVHGVPVIRVPLVPRGLSHGWQLAVNYASFAASATVVGLPRLRRHFDVMFVFEVSPITAALPAIALRRRRGTPLVLWVQDLWPDNVWATGAVRSPWLLAQISSLTRWIYAHCDHILAQSSAFIPRLEALGVNPGRVSYVPNWAESLYGPVQLEKEAAERTALPDGFRVLFAGNIGVSQDFGTVLSAAERLRDHTDIHWVVLGDGRMRPWVEREVERRQLGGTVHLLGQRPIETMPRYFSLADALLMSLRRDPIYSLVVPSKLQSYMACAKPVVAAIDGETARILRESGGGLAVRAQDAEALAEAVLSLYTMSPGDRRAMGQKSRQYFESHFERERLIGEIERILRDVAEKGRTP
jgi:glycosyltransferase involved in cell wall biosynthesis